MFESAETLHYVAVLARVLPLVDDFMRVTSVTLSSGSDSQMTVRINQSSYDWHGLSVSSDAHDVDRDAFFEELIVRLGAVRSLDRRSAMVLGVRVEVR